MDPGSQTEGQYTRETVVELPGCLEPLLVAPVDEKIEQQKLVSIYINTFVRPAITSLTPCLINPTPKLTPGI